MPADLSTNSRRISRKLTNDDLDIRRARGEVSCTVHYRPAFFGLMLQKKRYLVRNVDGMLTFLLGHVLWMQVNLSLALQVETQMR
jgi:hypothetical protein